MGGHRYDSKERPQGVKGFGGGMYTSKDPGDFEGEKYLKGRCSQGRMFLSRLASKEGKMRELCEIRSKASMKKHTRGTTASAKRGHGNRIQGKRSQRVEGVVCVVKILMKPFADWIREVPEENELTPDRPKRN